MEFSIKGINIGITPPFEQYVREKIGSVEKLTSSFMKKNATSQANVEVLRTTKHHKKGEYIRVNVSFIVSGVVFHASAESFDARVAIDMARDELARQVTSKSEKKTARYLRGARLLKRLTHLSPLAWFGWKKGARDREEGV